MRKVSVALFFVLFMSIGLISFQNTEVLVKSYKNWFMRGFNITSADITVDDLANSPDKGDWLNYHGDYGANRFSFLDQINTQNVDRLGVKWIYQVGADGSSLRSSPVVYQGVMYVTGPDEIHALDTMTGDWLWVWRAWENKTSSINRGVAIYRDRLFFSTGDYHLVALDRITGDVIWSRKYTETNSSYFSTMAPLIVRDKIIMGIANMSSKSRGFIAAFSVKDGSEIWRFWTLPKDSDLRGAPTWMTGSYDMDSNILYWGVGALERGSANYLGLAHAYDNSIIALDPNSGKVIWSTQLSKKMPLDWDATEPIVLTDMILDGFSRKVIIFAHRNGFLYVIDRLNGNIIFSKPFVEKIDWDGVDTCPSIWGGTNWMSPSLSKFTNLFYVMVLEGCRSGPNIFHLKAINLIDRSILWDYVARGPNMAAPGILSTGGNIIFSSEGSGHLVVLNSMNGKRIWDFSTGKKIFASPITYLSRGQQYISIVAGPDVITLGLAH